MFLKKSQCVVFDLRILDYVSLVIVSLVLPVLTNVITVTVETLVGTEMGIVFLSHLLRRFECSLQMVVGYLRLTCVLVDVRVHTESTPGITSDEEVPEPGLPVNLVLEPDLEIPPLYFRFVFHI